MASWLKQSTAVDIAMGPFLDSTDGVTAETALTISQADVRLKKNAGAWAQKNDANAATHEENGWYEVPLNATDTNTLGLLVVAVNETGALPVWREFLVVPANVYDSFFSTDLLQVDLTQISGSNVNTNAAQLGVNVVQVGSTIQTAGDIIGRIGTPAGASIAADLVTIDDFLDTEVAAIKAKTDQLTFSTANRVDAQVFGMENNTVTAAAIANGAIDAATFAAGAVDAAALAADAVTEIQSGLSTLDAAGIRTAVGLASANLDTQLTAIDDFLDTEVAAIKAKTDQLTFTVANVIDANVLRLNGVAASAANLERSASVIVRGTAITGTLSTTAMTTDLTEATDDHYNGRIVIWTSGVLTGQATDITDYTGATKLVTFTATTEAPSNNDTFVIV